VELPHTHSQKKPRRIRAVNPSQKLMRSVDAGKSDDNKTCVLACGFPAHCSADTIRNVLEFAGLAGTYEEISLPSRFVSKMGVGFVGDFFDITSAREAMDALMDASNFAHGKRPKVSRTNKVVLQVSAANIDSVNTGAASHTTGTPSSAGYSSNTCSDIGTPSSSGCSSSTRSDVVGTPSTSGCSSSICSDIGSDHDSDQVSSARLRAVVPLQRRRARSACRCEDKDSADIRLIGDGWQYSLHHRWSAQVSVKATFINVAELNF